MGGTIREICVKPGDTVKLGTKVLVLEAMKMENDITSDKDGVVKRILVAPNQVVATNAQLIEFE